MARIPMKLRAAVVAIVLAGAGFGIYAFGGSASANPSVTQTVLVSAPSSSVSGQSVTFTATVSEVPAGATPTGSVTFTVPGTPNACQGSTNTESLVSGVAQCTTTLLNASQDPSVVVTANYLGDPNNDPSTSNSVTQTVTKASTTVALTSTAEVPPVSQGGCVLSSSVNATCPSLVGVAPGAAVSDSGGAISAGTTVVSLDKRVSPNTLTLSQPATSSLTESLTFQDNPQALYPSGHAARYTATVSVVSPGGGSPTGNVTFSITPTGVGSPIVCSNGTAINVSRSGTATCVVAPGQLVAANAPYTVAASYSGDLSYTGSGGGPVSQGIAPLGSKAFIAGNPMPPVHDTPVHFTASVVPSQTGVTPTGTVTFMFTSQPITVSGCTLSTSSGNRVSGCPIPLADLQVGDVVSDLTTPGDIPSGTTVQAIGTNAVTLSNAPTSATGQEILFSPPVTVEGCSLSAGTSMVSGCSIPTADLQVGDVVTDQTTPADIPAGTTVGSIGADTVTLSNPPTTDTGQTIVFTPQPIVVTGCTLSATNSIVSGCSIPVANIQVGDVVADLTTPRNIPGGTTVQSIGSSTLTLSKAPTNASGQTVIITPPAPPDPAIVCGGGSNSITLTTSGATCSFAGGLPQAGSPFGVVASYSGDANDGASTSHSLFVKVH